MSDLGAFNLEPGQAVGGYVLISRLGSGAMGSVWRVRDEGGERYAMKILRDSFDDESGAHEAEDGGGDASRRDHVTARERLRREAMALRRIKHPGVCGIVDMELDDALAFIVTELIEGKNLQADVAANGRYMGDDLERLARKLIDAVKAVHAAGIIHRDIKPTNVMVAATGPVLVDFGIAMGEGENHVTRTGLVMGTPGFIAPEVVDGVESDERTDWWSTASVLAFAATGKPVFGTKPMMAVLERAAAGNASLPGLPLHTQEAFRCALDPERSKRCTPDSLLQAITEDAMHPERWINQSNEGVTMGGGTKAETAATGANEVVRPFDASDSPRTLWLDGFDNIAKTRPFAPTVTPGGSATAILPESGASTVTSLAASETPSTAMMPTAAPESTSRTQVFEPQTQVLAPTIPTQPAAFIPKADDTAPQNDRPGNLPGPQPVAAPGEIAVNPADIKRGAYLARGAMPVCLITPPLALLTAAMPLIGLLAAIVALWLLLTVGYNTESQLEREAKRGGTRKITDTALRAAAFPWHMVRAVAGIIPHVLLYAAISILGTLLTAMALALPTGSTELQIAGWVIPLRLLTEQPFSQSGLVVGGCVIIAWLITVFGPNSMLLRLAGGALRGLESGDTGPSHEQAVGSAGNENAGRLRHHGTRDLALMVIWLLLMVTVFLVAATSGQINWIPLRTPII